MAGLRYLALTEAQWGRLLERDALPPALAVARLAGGDATDERLRAWSGRFVPAGGEPLHMYGTLEAGK
ncbi:hypothetical protein ACFQ2M_09370 [Kitasatospora saccharophila]|uniref:hypothetical protein n=1 Tax=Kitasatospora saccharophila TaxID=407973 RepID=UPI003644264D